MLLWILAVLALYGIGSFSFGYGITKICALPDPGQVGSHSRGATNVLRSTKKPWLALFTLLGDALKAYLPIMLCVQYTMWPDVVFILMAIAVVVGHIFPVYLRFRGGKGVATTVGALLALDWRVGVGVICVWLITLVITRISSIASLLAIVLVSPLLMWYCQGVSTLWMGSIILALIVLLAHRENVKRLWRREEQMIWQK